MTLFKFTTDVVVSADSAEDAVGQIVSRLSVIKRHLGDGIALVDNAPFFVLEAVAAGEPADLVSDPVVRAHEDPAPLAQDAVPPDPAPPVAA